MWRRRNRQTCRTHIRAAVPAATVNPSKRRFGVFVTASGGFREDQVLHRWTTGGDVVEKRAKQRSWNPGLRDRNTTLDEGADSPKRLRMFKVHTHTRPLPLAPREALPCFTCCSSRRQEQNITCIVCIQVLLEYGKTQTSRLFTLLRTLLDVTGFDSRTLPGGRYNASRTDDTPHLRQGPHSQTMLP